MRIEIQTKITKTDLFVMPFYEGQKLTSSQKETLEQSGHPDFEGKSNETLMLYPKNKLTPRILLVGLGKQKDENEELWRQAGGTITQQFKKSIKIVTILPPKDDLALVSAFIEGLELAHYRYEDHINDAERKLHKLNTLKIILQDRKKKHALEKRIEEIISIVTAVKKTRDMITAPSNKMSPAMIAKYAGEIANKTLKMKRKVYNENKLKKIKMGCLVGVGKGAEEDTKLIILEYKNKPKNKKPIVLIGKGICFDAGGLNIKTRNLLEMKYDMAGAATVLGVMQILAERKPELHVIALAPCAENLVGANAVKPGDILTAYNGETVEITNTDAEGRLILCDAISYAVKHYKPEAIIDVATLTGAAIVALGYEMTALMTNNETLGNQIKNAATQTHEKVWELPLEKGYKKYIKSEIADLSNYNQTPSAGTIMGGLFLEHFTKGTPWVHLDMGGSAWTNEGKPYIPKGATGKSVRMLWEFLKKY